MLFAKDHQNRRDAVNLRLLSRCPVPPSKEPAIKGAAAGRKRAGNKNTHTDTALMHSTAVGVCKPRSLSSKFRRGRCSCFTQPVYLRPLVLLRTHTKKNNSTDSQHQCKKCSKVELSGENCCSSSNSSRTVSDARHQLKRYGKKLLASSLGKRCRFYS